MVGFRMNRRAPLLKDGKLKDGKPYPKNVALLPSQRAISSL
jgi:hypothetical protein